MIIFLLKLICLCLLPFDQYQHGIFFSIPLLFKTFIYLSGCLRSQLQLAGSLLHHVGSFTAGCGLSSGGVQISSCGTWALNCDLCASEHVGSVVVERAGAQLLCGMWDRGSPTRDRTCVPCIPRQILNHQTTREVPPSIYFNLRESLCLQVVSCRQYISRCYFLTHSGNHSLLINAFRTLLFKAIITVV